MQKKIKKLLIDRYLLRVLLGAPLGVRRGTSRPQRDRRSPLVKDGRWEDLRRRRKLMKPSELRSKFFDPRPQFDVRRPAAPMLAVQVQIGLRDSIRI